MTAPDRPARVALVDDHALLVQSLALALGARGLDVLALDPDRPLAPQVDGPLDVVLLDLALGEDGWGLDLLPQLRPLCPRVVVLTGETETRLLGEALLAGCRGALPKSAPVADIVAAVRLAVADEPLPTRWADPAWRAAARRHRADRAEQLADFDRLTGREQEVLERLVDGNDVTEIAQEAVVSVATVRTQVRGVLTKLGVTSQLQAVARARRAGWSRPDRESR